MVAILKFLSIYISAVLVLALPVNAQTYEAAELEELVDTFLSERNLDETKISFAYFNTVTGEEYMYNGDRLMLAGSVYKLPMNMYYYEQEALGNISPDTKYAGYTLEKCHWLSLQYSHNETAMAMRKSMGTYGEYKIKLDKYTGVSGEEIGGKYLENNYFSAYTMMNTLKYLYENSVFFEEAIGYLHEATPGLFFERYVTEYEIAQKYGQLDYATSTAGIVYTQTPYLLCVFTEHTGYSEGLIGSLNELFCDYTVSHNLLERSEPLFYDVRTRDWFYEYLSDAVASGMMAGTGDGKFEPNGQLKISEAIKLACKIHSLSAENPEKLEPASSGAWYKPYVDYAILNGLINESEFKNYNKNATRAEVAGIFARAIPAGELESTDEVVVPDVGESDEYGEAIYDLYRAGLLTGNDAQGRFEPDTAISRAQATALIMRVSEFVK